MKITTYKYEKVPVSDTEIFIPNKPFYCFQTGIRRSVRIIPYFFPVNSPLYKKGDLYELNITCVYGSFEAKIEKFTIRISDVENLATGKNTNSHSSIIKMLLEDDYNVRTKEQFNADLNNVLKCFEL